MRRSMSAKRYPPLLDWVELGAIAAAPLAEVCVGAVVVGDCWVVVSVDVLVLVLVGVVVGVVAVVPDDVAEVVSVGADVVVPVDVLVLVLAGVVEVEVEGVVVVAGGGGAPAVGGSVEVFGPVTSAPFWAVIVTNEEESGVWMLASAPPTLPSCPAVRYPTAPAGGRTSPMLPASRWIR